MKSGHENVPSLPQSNTAERFFENRELHYFATIEKAIAFLETLEALEKDPGQLAVTKQAAKRVRRQPS